MSMYHVAKFEFKEGDILKTHVPHHLIKYEGDIPRICVSNHPLKCILALHPVINKGKVYNKTYTTLYYWIYDRFYYKGNIAMKKVNRMKNLILIDSRMNCLRLSRKETLALSCLLAMKSFVMLEEVYMSLQRIA